MAVAVAAFLALCLPRLDTYPPVLPINMSRPGWYDEPLTLQQALGRVDPDVILLDRFMTTYLDENASPERSGHQDAVGVKAFMAERGARLVCSIRDHTYGTMHVYHLVR